MNHDHDSHSGAPMANSPDCERALAEVYTYLDQELTDEMRVQIAAHLESCNPCFEAFDFEAELRMVISTKTQSVEVPETLRIRIEEKLSFLRIESSGRSDAGNGGESRREA
jgi:mycothiol system anti-sigma-R factor